jgi:hypothetical protein
LNHDKNSGDFLCEIKQDESFSGGAFLVEVSPDSAFKKSQFIYSKLNKFSHKVTSPGLFYFRVKYCLENEICGQLSRVEKFKVSLPPLLSAPELKKSYIFKKPSPLPRTPDNENVLDFGAVVGAKSYKIIITKKDDKTIAFEATTTLNQVSLPDLNPGFYHLRIYPLDGWERVGKVAESEILIEAEELLIKPEVASHKDVPKAFRHSLYLFGGVNLAQVGQWNSSATTDGGTYSFQNGGLNYIFKRDENSWDLGHEFYHLTADSKGKKRSQMMRETYAGFGKKIYLGLSYTDIPFFKANNGDYILQNKPVLMFDLGYKINQVLKHFNMAIHIRKTLGEQSGVSTSYGGFFRLEHRTLLLKNQLTWYNGLDIHAYMSEIEGEERSTYSLWRREFLKTGILFEF